ncbi:alpha/beta fold hydrolase [Amycolatopsis magusensis]|uniref:Pimeloyl-ACP methyl ester carboxylesterase n=1 Tax=Amycolatopsis magusensis TaxID=882444 RepID=A0ABS4Q5P4_9PSEU|nr:alpha/beta hydrolase [Amycolatopsis magusensis]MBP2187007.1 pimeloyl-ACP methyl ester carboxylesterase [Amycolatopsis magusensis]
MEIDRKRIAYLESPGDRDERAVVFVHGNSSSAKTWAPLLAGDFGRRFRCLALDLPGHGQSEPAGNQDDYSLPGYAAVLAGFAQELGASDAVVVGWSLGGQIALEAVPALPDAGGFVLFGAPPIATVEQMPEAFLPNPAMGALFREEVSESEAKLVAESFVAPGSPLDSDEFVPDILATDGSARTGLGSSVGAGRFADELAIVSALEQPLAIVQGAEEQLVNLDYLRKLTIPTLWRGEVQVLPGVGHAPHREAPREFATLLTRFIDDLRT